MVELFKMRQSCWKSIECRCHHQSDERFNAVRIPHYDLLNERISSSLQRMHKLDQDNLMSSARCKDNTKLGDALEQVGDSSPCIVAGIQYEDSFILSSPAIRTYADRVYRASESNMIRDPEIKIDFLQGMRPKKILVHYIIASPNAAGFSQLIEIKIGDDGKLSAPLRLFVDGIAMPVGIFLMFEFQDYCRDVSLFIECDNVSTFL